MDAARAMGTFLRTWRAEWAGLSQAQLAVAVSAHCGGTHRIEKYTIGEWEKGQAPHSTAELEALLGVMRRHGITETEAGDFRQAVFAACCSRHYPELFADTGTAHSEDVDGLAYELHRREEAAPGATSIVDLVALQSELEQAVTGEEALQAGRTQRCRQHTALAWVRSVLGRRHWRHASRPAQAARVFSSNCDSLAAQFGPRGLPPDLSVLGQRSCQVYAELQAAGVAGRPDEARGRARALLGLYREAWEARDFPAAIHSLFLAVYPHGLPSDEAVHVLREGQRHSMSHPEVGMPVPYRHAALCACATAVGLFAPAERHLAVFGELGTGDPDGRALGHTLTGHLARSRGDAREAQTSFEGALQLAVERADPEAARAARASLEALDRRPGPGGTPSFGR